MLSWLVLALGLGSALSLFVRTGTALARSCAVLVMLALAVAALVPPRPERVQAEASVAIACSQVPSSGGLAERIATLLANAPLPAPQVALLGDGSPLERVAALAAMRAGPRRGDVIAVWNGPLADAAETSSPLAGRSYTTTAPLPFAPESLSLEAATAPRAGRPLRLLASVDGAVAALSARLVTDNAAVHHEQALVLPVSGSAAVDLSPPEEGSVAVLLECDLPPHRITRTGSFAVRASESVLVLEPTGTIAGALTAQGLTVRAVSSLPADLSDFDAVVLGQPLPADVQRQLVQAVDDGLGLFVFGSGLQQDGEPLRALLPITVLPRAGKGAGDGPGEGEKAPVPEPTEEPRPPEPQKDPSGVHADDPQVPGDGPVEVDRHALAMVFVIDRSGSMGTRVIGGGTKMSYAKTSARQTALALMEGDEVALITFGDDDQARVEMPLTSAVDRDAVEQGIARLAHSNERTYLDHGLVRARELLLASTAAVRHVVVLTDGEVWDQELVLRKRTNTMRLEGITVSMVSIVDEGTLATFQGMAERVVRDGGGLFLPVRDARVVPQLVSAEVVRALDRVGRKPNGTGDAPSQMPPQPLPPDPPTAQKPEKPAPRVDDPAIAEGDRELRLQAVASSPLLLPELVEWPSLRDAVTTNAHRSAHVLLVAGEDGLPVLVYGNRGLGRIGVFAADLAGADAVRLREEASFSARLSQWVTASLRALPEGRSEVLSTATVEPPAPLPREVALMAAMSGSPPLPIEQLELPPPLQTIVHRSQVPSWALGAAFLLLGLAFVEWWTVRRAS